MSSSASAVAGVTYATSAGSPATLRTTHAAPVTPGCALTAVCVASTSTRILRIAIFCESAAPGGGQSASKWRSSDDIASVRSAIEQRSANLMRCTLFVAFLGTPVMYTTTCGHLDGWSRSPLHFWSAGRSTRVPGFSGTITQPTTSCSESCGAENAITLATCGCESSASSTSNGEMISPPRLMTSFERPVMYR